MKFSPDDQEKLCDVYQKEKPGDRVYERYRMLQEMIEQFGSIAAYLKRMVRRYEADPEFLGKTKPAGENKC